jgi:hypothetical protein
MPSSEHRAVTSWLAWTQMSAPNRCELHGPHGEQIESSQGIEGIGTSASATAAWRRVLSLP